MARSILVGALACVASFLAASAGAQDSAKKYPLDIPRQQLTKALEALAKQTDVRYGYIPDSAQQEAILVGPLRGEYTIGDALNELLRSTGLTFTRINSRNIVIVREPPPPPKVEAKPPKPPRVARRAPAAAPRVQPIEDRIIDEVFSQASKYRELPAPTAAGFVLDRKVIEHSGVATVMDLVRLLPQQPFLRPDGSRSNGAQYVELRGLGPDTTLVLINGHRAFASAASFSVNAFDLNQLPLSAVDHVEVQLDSISVRHGADAIGGIVNVVLRDDIERPSVEARYGAAAGGGEQRQTAISAGYAGDDSRAAVILDYRDVSPLFGAERDLWRNQDYRRFGSSDLRSTLSSPGNVFAMPGTLLPGLGAPFAAIPERSAGAIAEASQFLPFQLNQESLARYLPIVSQDRRASVVASAEASLTPDLAAAADLMVVDRRVVFESLPPLASAIVPATNPYNSFQVPVGVAELLDGIDPLRASVDSLLVRGTGSLRGKLQSWDWELSLLRSEEDAEQRIDNVLDPVRLAQVLADPDPERTLNLFTPGPAASPEVLAGVLAPSDVDNFRTDATQLAGVLSGNVLALPAGNVSTVLGTQWRREVVEFDSVLGSFDREVAGGFAEVHVPLLGERIQLPAARELTMTLAGRFDLYTDFGEIFSPQYGVVWSPLRAVRIRGTYGRSFRAPSLYELYLPHELSQTLISDPRRNGEAYLAYSLGGGNRDLQATHGESFTTGIEFTPETIRPLALSATYWHVTMDNRVTALTSTAALLRESAVAEHVLRAEPTAEDLAAGLPGRVLQIDLTRMNFGRLTTSGVDIGAGYAFDTEAGRFAADVKGTWIDEYEALDLPGAPAADRVDVANPLGTIARWRAIASLEWQRGALGATSYVRYIPSYDDTREGARNGRTIASQTFLDLQFSVDLGKLLDRSPLLRGLQLTAGANNALDQQPPFAEVNGIQGYDTSQGDLKGRFWYLRLGKTF